MNRLDTTSDISNLSLILSFVFSKIGSCEPDSQAGSQIRTAVEELFVNISKYAYDSGEGPVTVKAGTVQSGSLAVVSFSDKGSPFDPLSRPDPELKGPVIERRKGGLGIFMVKKMMDEVSYEYIDGQNIITIKKIIV